MRLDRQKKAYSFSFRDLAVFRQVGTDFSEITKVTPKYKGMPPIWSKMSYLMMVHDLDLSTNYFWKIYRRFGDMLKARDRFYQRAVIPKNSDGVRRLMVPDPELRRHQRFILKEILNYIPVSEHACAYRAGKGLVDLAQPHVGQEVLIHLDIRDFFSSITEQMVYTGLLRETGYPKAVAGLLSRLCCYRGYLPQGACTSPALSNICFMDCDAEISAIAKRYHLAYTRYSDDIFLSGNPEKPQEIIREVKAACLRYGFRVNGKKTKILGQHQAQKVTAIVVNRKMQVSRDYRRKLRQEIYYLEKHGANARDVEKAGGLPEYLFALQGRIAFVLHVDPENQEFLEAKELVTHMLFKKQCDDWDEWLPF